MKITENSGVFLLLAVEYFFAIRTHIERELNLSVLQSLNLDYFQRHVLKPSFKM